MKIILAKHCITAGHSNCNWINPLDLLQDGSIASGSWNKTI